MSAAQEEFDSVYITSSEIRDYLGVTRAAIVHGKERGLLPDPIIANGGQIQLWRRADVMPYIDAWKLMLQARRGELRHG